MKARRLLVTGAVSLSNKGTCSILITLLDELSRQFEGELDFTVELFYPEIQSRIYELERQSVTVVAPLIEKPLRGLAWFVLACVLSPLRSLRVWDRSRTMGLGRYRSMDAVIDVSAEAFVRYYDDDVLQSSKRYLMHLYPLLMARLIGVPYALAAQTLAPFGCFRCVMRSVLRHASFVSVRDSISLSNLASEGIDTRDVKEVADPAFLLAGRKVSREALRVAEAADESRASQAQNQGPIVGLVSGRATGRKLRAQEYRNLEAAMAEAADILVEAVNASIVFLPHSTGAFNRAGDDSAAGKQIRAQMKHGERIHVLAAESPPEEIKGAIAECDVLVSLRMHPAIAALEQGVPVVLIAFNDKAYGLMRRFQLEEFVIDIHSVEATVVAEQVMKALTMQASLRRLILKRRESVVELAVGGIRHLARWLQTLNHRSSCA